MSGAHSNQFALFSHEASDSDDSGYVEDDADAPAGDHVNHVIPAHTPLEPVIQRRWAVVPRNVWHTRQTMGAIVRHVDLHHFPTGGAPVKEGSDVVNLPGGGEILAKSRLFLVVGRTVDKIIECPMFTYGEKGLCDRKQSTWHEYCSIRSLSIPVEGFRNQSPNNEVLDVEWEKRGFHVKRSSVVRLSEFRFRDDNAGVTLVAAISSGALRYARGKVNDLISAAVTTARQ